MCPPLYPLPPLFPPPNKVWGKAERGRGGKKYTYILHVTYIIYIYIFGVWGG